MALAKKFYSRKRRLAESTGGWDTGDETACYFETLTRIFRNVNPNARRPVLMIPAGHVINELDKSERCVSTRPLPLLDNVGKLSSTSWRKHSAYETV